MITRVFGSLVVFPFLKKTKGHVLLLLVDRIVSSSSNTIKEPSTENLVCTATPLAFIMSMLFFREKGIEANMIGPPPLSPSWSVFHQLVEALDNLTYVVRIGVTYVVTVTTILRTIVYSASPK